MLRGFQNAVQLLAAVEVSHVDFTQNGLEDFRDIGGLNASGNHVLGSAKDKILNQEQINLVPVGRKFFWLVQVALQKEAQAFHARHSGVTGMSRITVDQLVANYYHTDEAKEMGRAFNAKQDPDPEKFYR